MSSTPLASEYFNDNTLPKYNCSGWQITLPKFQEEDLNEFGIGMFETIKKTLQEPGKSVEFVRFEQLKSGSWMPDEKSPHYKTTDLKLIMNNWNNLSLVFNMNGQEFTSSTARYIKKIDGKTHVITTKGSHYVF